jgi:tetratricopeptide (TPR) repeat protein
MSTFEAFIQAGLKASADGNAELAMTQFEFAQELAPSSGLPDFLIASELAASAQIEKAERHFARALLLDNNLVIARYQLGLLQFSSRRPEVGLITWQPLLALSELHAVKHFVMGFAALLQNDISNALENFKTGIPLSDNPAVNSDINKIIQKLQHDAATSKTPSSTSEKQENEYQRPLHNRVNSWIM